MAVDEAYNLKMIILRTEDKILQLNKCESLYPSFPNNISVALPEINTQLLTEDYAPYHPACSPVSTIGGYSEYPDPSYLGDIQQQLCEENLNPITSDNYDNCYSQNYPMLNQLTNYQESLTVSQETDHTHEGPQIFGEMFRQELGVQVMQHEHTNTLPQNLQFYLPQICDTPQPFVNQPFQPELSHAFSQDINDSQQWEDSQICSNYFQNIPTTETETLGTSSSSIHKLSSQEDFQQIGDDYYLGGSPSLIIDETSSVVSCKIPAASNAIEDSSTQLVKGALQDLKEFVTNMRNEKESAAETQSTFHKLPLELINSQFQPTSFTKTTMDIQKRAAKKKTLNKRHPCSYCNKLYSSRCYVRKHMINAHKFGPYFCKSCSQAFDSKLSLSKHTRLHTFQVICNVCKNTFYSKYTLAAHMKVHAGQLDYECKVCKRKYFTRYALQVHTLRHQQNGPHKCNKCNLMFSKRSSLNMHYSIVHNGECYIARMGRRFSFRLPYKCNLCGKRFSSKNSLKYHQNLLVSCYSRMTSYRHADSGSLPCSPKLQVNDSSSHSVL